jgi:hypothetical protein
VNNLTEKKSDGICFLYCFSQKTSGNTTVGCTSDSVPSDVFETFSLVFMWQDPWQQFFTAYLCTQLVLMISSLLNSK